MPLTLTDYKLLSFDIYATLIDWETGIYTALQPMLERLPSSRLAKEILRSYSAHEIVIQAEQPKALYADVLGQIYGRLAKELGVQAPSPTESQKFSSSIGTWPAYPDTVEAMKVLGKHYKLVVLSNVDRASFSQTLSGPLSGVHFDAIYTAEDIGSYKPDLNNFRYLISNADKELGVKKETILHVAQSLTHDHVPAKEIGLQPGVWISRGGGEGRASAMGGDMDKLQKLGQIELGTVYESLAGMAEDVERAFSRKPAA